jgi:predicted ATPase
MIMAYPSATLLEISNSGLRPIEFHETNHFKIMRNFCLNPDGFMDGLVFEADELIDEEDV